MKRADRKKLRAHLTILAAHAIGDAAAADRKIGHVAISRRVVRVLAAQRQQIAAGFAEFLLGISPEVSFDKPPDAWGLALR